MNAARNIRRHDPAQDEAWDRYAASHPRYTVYHSTAFRSAVADAFGKEAHGFVATDEQGTIRGVLPLIRQKSPVFGDRLVSLPYANHGGPLADEPETAVALLQAAARHADALDCDRLEIRDHERRAVDWPERTDKVLLTRELPSSPEALDRELGSKLRSQCRRALKEGAEVLHGGADLVTKFHAVFAENMRDLGTPVYPQRWFEVLAKRLPAQAQLIVVRLAGRPAAAAFLLRWTGTLEIPWAASSREFNRYSVNMLLYREALGRAIALGCQRFDFGRSTQDSGTHRFKLQWGAEASPIHWRVRPRGGASSSGHHAGGEEGRLKAMATRAWTRLPLAVANRLGPMVAPELPW
jgi:FemAB-related protein (PEP-CTERM system-associated)